MNSLHVALKSGFSCRPVTAKLAAIRLLALVYCRHVNGQVVLLSESFLTKLACICTMLFMNCLNVLLQVILSLESV